MSLRSSFPSVLLMAAALVAGPGRLAAQAAPVTAAELAQFFGVSASALDAPLGFLDGQPRSRAVVEGSGIRGPVFTVSAQPGEFLFLVFGVQLLSDQPPCADPATCPGRDSLYVVSERVGAGTAVLELFSTADPLSSSEGRFGYDRGTPYQFGFGFSGLDDGASYRLGFAAIDGDVPGGDSGVVVDSVELRRYSASGGPYDVVWGQYFEQGWGDWERIGATELAGCSPFVVSCVALLRTDGSTHPPLDPGGDVTVPEPSTLALAGLGLAGVIARRTVRRRAALHRQPSRAVSSHHPSNDHCHVAIPWSLHMRRFAASLALVAATAAAPATAAPVLYTDHADFIAATTALTVDHFDSAPWAEGNYAGAVTSLDTTWSAASMLRATTFGPRSGSLALSDVDANPDVPDVLTATLPAGTTAAGLWARSGVSWLQAEVAALAADDTVLASFSGWLPDSYVFLGFAGDTPIHRLRVRALSTGNDDFIVDDFVRGTGRGDSTVPEPATTVLLACAASVLGVRRLRA